MCRLTGHEHHQAIFGQKLETQFSVQKRKEKGIHDHAYSLKAHSLN